MNQRTRVLIGLTLLMPLLAALLLPAVRWRLIGWAKGEAFFEGRPTSWWADDIQASFQPIPELTEGRPIDDNSVVASWYRNESPPMWDEWLRWLRPGSTQASASAAPMPPLLSSDPAAMPVLVELLRRPEAKVRQVAVCGLAAAGPPARELVRVAAGDADPQVRRDAAHALEALHAGAQGP